MRRTSYIKRASRRFLEGLKCKTPADAVETGLRTMSQWTTILSEEREREVTYLQERLQAKRNDPRARTIRSLLM
jgi:hypothetical protein